MYHFYGASPIRNELCSERRWGDNDVQFVCVGCVFVCVCEGIVRGLCSCVGVEQVVNSDCSVERKKTRFRAYTREKLFKAKQLNKHTVFN